MSKSFWVRFDESSECGSSSFLRIILFFIGSQFENLRNVFLLLIVHPSDRHSSIDVPGVCKMSLPFQHQSIGPRWNNRWTSNTNPEYFLKGISFCQCLRMTEITNFRWILCGFVNYIFSSILSSRDTDVCSCCDQYSHVKGKSDNGH